MLSFNNAGSEHLFRPSPQYLTSTRNGPLVRLLRFDVTDLRAVLLRLEVLVHGGGDIPSEETDQSGVVFFSSRIQSPLIGRTSFRFALPVMVIGGEPPVVQG